MKNIWLIRHGECHSNTGEKTTHPGTSALTETGISQSQRVADYIDCGPDIIIHSPYVRSLQTAQPTIDKFPGTPVEEWPVQEFIYLAHERYLNTTQNERKAEVDNYWRTCDPLLKNSEQAESFVGFIDRMANIIEQLSHREGNVIIFTHGHVIRAMMWHIIAGKLQKDKTAMEHYRSLRHALYIPNAVILKTKLDEPELYMSQMITAHLNPEPERVT